MIFVVTFSCFNVDLVRAPTGLVINNAKLTPQMLWQEALGCSLPCGPCPQISSVVPFAESRSVTGAGGGPMMAGILWNAETKTGEMDAYRIA